MRWFKMRIEIGWMETWTILNMRPDLNHTAGIHTDHHTDASEGRVLFFIVSDVS